MSFSIQFACCHPCNETKLSMPHRGTLPPPAPARQPPPAPARQPPPAPARQPPPVSDDAFGSPAPGVDSLVTLVPRVNWPAVALPAIILTLMLLLCSGMSLYGIMAQRQVLRVACRSADTAGAEHEVGMWGRGLSALGHVELGSIACQVHLMAAAGFINGEHARRGRSCPCSGVPPACARALQLRISAGYLPHGMDTEGHYMRPVRLSDTA